ADHYIGNVRHFHEVLRSAVATASRGDKIVTLGITPHSPETGYGYIHCGELADTFTEIPVYRANRFLEKPDRARALEFLSSGDYLWNSGMFVWRIDMIRGMIEKHLPLLAEGFKEIGDSLGTDQHLKTLKKVYSGLTKVSVDYGIMEQAGNVFVIPCDFGWDDIGSWTALERYVEKDEHGNVLHGKGVLLDTFNTYVTSKDKTVALLGVKDLIIINDNDSLLICHKSQAQEIKKVVQALNEQGFDRVL
ncbi:MAG TPA: mannose-1-phosphate guanylyltransferase, partial [Desulfotomaculum sp.]|nr:mannose-1-phosphate guanylyltransferase [Desulfotomaculum sp.]